MIRKPRPPKPDGIKPQPRTLRKLPSNESIFNALDRLARQSPQPSDFETWHDEIKAASNDRGAGILAATEVENRLEKAILFRLYLKVSSNGSELFIPSAPLGTFDAKIKIAFALGIIGPDTRELLNSIRKIRNAFAHAQRPIKFSTAEVDSVVKTMGTPKMRKPNLSSIWEIPDLKEQPRATFIRICNAVSLNLASYAMDALQRFPPPDGDEDYLMIPIPLALP